MKILLTLFTIMMFLLGGLVWLLNAMVAFCGNDDCSIAMFSSAVPFMLGTDGVWGFTLKCFAPGILLWICSIVYLRDRKNRLNP